MTISGHRPLWHDIRIFSKWIHIRLKEMAEAILVEDVPILASIGFWWARKQITANYSLFFLFFFFSKNSGFSFLLCQFIILNLQEILRPCPHLVIKSFSAKIRSEVYKRTVWICFQKFSKFSLRDTRTSMWNMPNADWNTGD